MLAKPTAEVLFTLWAIQKIIRTQTLTVCQFELFFKGNFVAIQKIVWA